MNVYEIVKRLESLCFDKATSDNSRKVIAKTGRGGAIFYKIRELESIQKEILGRKLTNIEKEEIKNQVESQIWEDGMYTISTEKGLEYDGLWSDDDFTGNICIKRHGNYYVEKWVDGYRSEYKIISKEEFEELKLLAINEEE